jgi:hypothetical protein
MGLPAGGNSVMMVSTSEDPAEVEAAWKFVKFATSGVGAVPRLLRQQGISHQTRPQMIY